MSNPNVKTSFVLIRPPPFGVDRPPSDSPIISSLSNSVNIPQQKTKPLDAQRASCYNTNQKGGFLLPQETVNLINWCIWKLAASFSLGRRGYFLLIVAITIPRLIACNTTRSKLQTSLNAIRPPPFGVDRPPSDSPIISSLSNLVNIPQQKTKPLTRNGLRAIIFAIRVAPAGTGGLPCV